MATNRDKITFFAGLSSGGLATTVTQAECSAARYGGYSITGNSILTCTREINPGETDVLKIAKVLATVITDLYKANPNN